MNTRSRSWCFTTNNYTEEHITLLDDISSTASYLCYGKEVAPTTQTKHLQGFLYFDNAKTFSKIQKLLPKGSHIEVAKGNALENREYCKKEGDFVEFGTIPSQGKRNDLNLVKDEIVKGGGMKEIIEIATNYQSLKTAELLLKYKEQKRNWKPQVVWLYGESGCGKTKTAYDVMPNCYRKTNSTGKWWDGYDADPDVLLDDIKDNSSQMYSLLLELLDRYDCRVETKGGSRQFLARRIYITSIYHPDVLFHNIGDTKELIRRIDEIKEIKNVILLDNK